MNLTCLVTDDVLYELRLCAGILKTELMASRTFPFANSS
jgi:hypothetical protein